MIEEQVSLVTPELQKTIDENMARLREKNPKVRRIFAVIVKGTEFDDKDLYVGYFAEPGFKAFSKYISFMTNNQQIAGMRSLATDCFLDGDKELFEDDSLFLYGTMGQLSKIIEARDSQLVNLSKPRK